MPNLSTGCNSCSPLSGTHAVHPAALVVVTRSSERRAADALGVEAMRGQLGVVPELGQRVGHGLALEVVAEAVYTVSDEVIDVAGIWSQLSVTHSGT